MTESIGIAAAVSVTERLPIMRRRICLLALLLLNWLVLCGALVMTFGWADYWGLKAPVLGVLFSQLYLLSLWGAWRGGWLVVRLGMPFLIVVAGGLLAFDFLESRLRHWPTEFAFLPVPLGVLYLLGVILL